MAAAAVPPCVGRVLRLPGQRSPWSQRCKTVRRHCSAHGSSGPTTARPPQCPRGRCFRASLARPCLRDRARTTALQHELHLDREATPTAAHLTHVPVGPTAGLCASCELATPASATGAAGAALNQKKTELHHPLPGARTALHPAPPDLPRPPKPRATARVPGRAVPAAAPTVRFASPESPPGLWSTFLGAPASITALHPHACR